MPHMILFSFIGKRYSVYAKKYMFKKIQQKI